MLKNYIKAILTALCTIYIFTSSPAYSLDYVESFIPNLKKVGEGRMTYLLWEIYDAALYAPEGTLQKGKPFALKLSYLRNIEGKKIADISIEEMRKQGITNEIKLATWHAQMNAIFPNVKKGASLTGVYTNTGETIFYDNDKEIGRISDQDFSESFFNIWLSEKTSAPDLRRLLLGGA